MITAHPRSQYESIGKIFGGRKVFKMKAIKLVAEARYVLALGSTAIGSPVLFKKPIIFPMLSQAISRYFRNLISSYAKQFNNTSLEVGFLFNQNCQDELRVNGWLYAAYKENFLEHCGRSSDSPIDYIEKRDRAQTFLSKNGAREL